MIGQRLTDADGNVYEIVGQYGGGWALAALDPLGPAEVVSTAELHARFGVAADAPQEPPADPWAAAFQQARDGDDDAPERFERRPALGEGSRSDKIVIRNPDGLSMPSPEAILRMA